MAAHGPGGAAIHFAEAILQYRRRLAASPRFREYLARLAANS
jgi:hypothetical protein